MQQRYAAAALQKLEWYYTPQTKRWYKPINTPPTVDNFGRVCASCPFEPVLQALALMRSYTIDGAVQSRSKTRAFSCCIGSAGIADA